MDIKILLYRHTGRRIVALAGFMFALYGGDNDRASDD
jgi:hypothetical protein